MSSEHDKTSGPYLREVRVDWREGRGKWWRPDGKGYTNHIANAGLYAEVYETERTYSVRAAEVLSKMESDVESLGHHIAEFNKAS